MCQHVVRALGSALRSPNGSVLSVLKAYCTCSKLSRRVDMIALLNVHGQGVQSSTRIGAKSRAELDAEHGCNHEWDYSEDKAITVALSCSVESFFSNHVALHSLLST